MTTPVQATHHADRFERTWVLREQRESIERLQHEMGALLEDGGFGEAAAFATKPVRGTDPAVGETTVMVYDMANPRKGGDDWVKSVITGLRLDLDDDAGGEFTLHQIAIVNIPGGAAPEAQPAPTPPAAP